MCRTQTVMVDILLQTSKWIRAFANETYN